MDPASYLSSIRCTNITYIGDGVYVGFDGTYIWLVTQREEGLHRIALEPRTYFNLMDWLRRTPANIPHPI